MCVFATDFVFTFMITAIFMRPLRQGWFSPQLSPGGVPSYTIQHDCRRHHCHSALDMITPRTTIVIIAVFLPVIDGSSVCAVLKAGRGTKHRKSYQRLRKSMYMTLAGRLLVVVVAVIFVLASLLPTPQCSAIAVVGVLMATVITTAVVIMVVVVIVVCRPSSHLLHLSLAFRIPAFLLLPPSSSSCFSTTSLHF